MSDQPPRHGREPADMSVPEDDAQRFRLAALYEQVFPAWEREPTERIITRLASGRYASECLRDPDGAMLGFYIVDCVPTLAVRVLTFVAVAPAWRHAGLGTHLVRAAIAAFRRQTGLVWLFVEAEPPLARLYERCGFRALALDYRVPHYDDPAASQAMTLLGLPRGDWPTSIAGSQVAAVIRHAFRDGYGVGEGDPRLAAQCRRIPQWVRVGDAEFSSEQ